MGKIDCESLTAATVLLKHGWPELTAEKLVFLLSRNSQEKEQNLMADSLLSLRDASKALGVCRGTLMNYVNHGFISASRLAGKRKILIQKSSIDHFLEKSKIQISNSDMKI